MNTVKKCLVVFFLSMILIGCSSSNKAAISEDVVVYLEQFGPNNDSDTYYCYTKSKDGQPNRSLCLYDIEQQKEEVIFEVEDSSIDEIYYYDLQDEIVRILVGRLDKDLHEEVDLEYQYNTASKEIAQIDYDENSLAMDTKTTYASVTVDAGKKVLFKKTIGESTYYYSVDGGQNYLPIEGLDDKAYSESGIYDNSLIYLDGKIYGVITAVYGTGHGPLGIVPLQNCLTSQIKEEKLFVFDPKSETADIIYKNSTGSSRIIGYCDGWLYTFNGTEIIRTESNTKKKEAVAQLNISGDSKFSWCGNKLIVFDSEKEQVVCVADR
ncbi:hypothetical protein SAMN02910275_02026 [Butyrivibrio sp. INlla18]|uniref:hypothetical protein n=1 Tax=Butyrivibrio sp. INlla18 TaxID=1520806 RepID=UPI00088E5122|nr:hypothetical protein [Butyrivibrio sp. INlla18]SDA67103.1 hypothetical protein SAMN02910275_02026 [Butyrivibrio sp. INlla18]